ncbi:hypothetical protein RKD35_003638 [Streptomyces albogriseolus]
MQPEDAGEPMDRALLIGVSDYRFTKRPHGVPGKLPAVEHNVPVLHEALVRAGVFADEEIVSLQSPDFAEAARELQRVAREARGLLLVYFAGHGAIPSGGDELYLQLRDAQVFAGEHTVFNGAVSFSDLMGTVLVTSRADRVVVVLDCCFAGNAARVWEHFEDKRRVVLLMSVQANHRIDAGDPGTPTPYTENLAELLGEEDGTTVSRLAARLRERMAEQKRRTLRNEPWEPQLRADAGADAVRLGGRKARRSRSCHRTGPARPARPRVPRVPLVPRAVGCRRGRRRCGGARAPWRRRGPVPGGGAGTHGPARAGGRGRPAASCSGSPCRCCSPSACSAWVCTGRWAWPAGTTPTATRRSNCAC